MRVKKFVQYLNKNKIIRELILFPALTCRDKVLDLFNILFILNNKKRIKEFKDIHKGKRCFIIGNGPSLRMEDLDMIENEYSFASNRIFQLYNKTIWRPTYYGLMDKYVYEKIKEDIQTEEDGSKIRFLVGNRKNVFSKETLADNRNRFYLLGTSWHPKVPIGFSKDCSRILKNGRTITFVLMQLAIYMGFSEIYLLGIDHNWGSTIDKSGNGNKELDRKNHVSGMKTIIFESPAISNLNGHSLDKPTEAYKKAYEYALKNNIKMYNATRGGELEVFPRVNFDDLFDNDKV